MENYFGSRALKKLIGRGQGSDSGAVEARKVASKLWESSMKGRCKDLSSSHAAKASDSFLQLSLFVGLTPLYPLHVKMYSTGPHLTC